MNLAIRYISNRCSSVSFLNTVIGVCACDTFCEVCAASFTAKSALATLTTCRVSCSGSVAAALRDDIVNKLIRSDIICGIGSATASGRENHSAIQAEITHTSTRTNGVCTAFAVFIAAKYSCSAAVKAAFQLFTAARSITDHGICFTLTANIDRQFLACSQFNGSCRIFTAAAGRSCGITTSCTPYLKLIGAGLIDRNRLFTAGIFKYRSILCNLSLFSCSVIKIKGPHFGSIQRLYFDYLFIKIRCCFAEIEGINRLIISNRFYISRNDHDLIHGRFICKRDRIKGKTPVFPRGNSLNICGAGIKQGNLTALYIMNMSSNNIFIAVDRF